MDIRWGYVIIFNQFNMKNVAKDAVVAIYWCKELVTFVVYFQTRST